MLRVDYVNELETRTSTIRRQRVESVSLSVAALERSTALQHEPGYPISGDMLAVKATGNEPAYRRRRRRFYNLTVHRLMVPKGWSKHV